MQKVSVIIPIYNVEPYIKRCLKSVLQQSYTDYEVICVDDCGSDSSMEIVRRAARRFPDRIRIVGGESNRGLGGARELGMQAARGDYICFIDSDDYIAGDYLETYMHRTEQENADVIVGGFVRDEGRRQYVREVDLQDEEFLWVYPSACVKFYRRSFLEEHGIDFRGVRRYEDEWFNYRILISKPQIAVMKYAGYHYCLNPDSITRSARGDRTQIYLEYEQLVRTFLREQAEAVQNRQVLQYCIASGLTANLLYNGRGCGIRRMNELYRGYQDVIDSLPGKITRNPYVSLRRLPSEARNNRYAAWLVFRAKCLHLDRILFWIAGCM